MPTTVVNRRVTSAYDVYIGRPSKWGNPFKIGQRGRDGKLMDRVAVIAAYRRYLYSFPTLLRDIHELSDKVLGCWCAPALCHGDVLAELCNAGEPDPDRIVWASGEVICVGCNRAYHEHPFAPYLSWDFQPYLHQGCGGWLLKL